MRTIVIATALIFAVVLGACGKSSERPAAAELVPAGSPIYGEVTLDPEGDDEDAVQAIAARFPGGRDLSGKIERFLQKTFREDGLDYAKDVKPWLGDEAVFFISELKEGDPEGAMIVPTDDEDATTDVLANSDKGKAKKSSYEGTDLFEDSGGAFGAVVDGNLVFGTESGVKDAIDTTKEGADSIEDSDKAKEALGRLEDPLAAVYLDVGTLLEEADPDLEAYGALLNVDEPYAIGVRAEPDAVVIDSTGPTPLTALANPLVSGSGTDAVQDLPADAWLAFGQPDIGKAVQQLLTALQSVDGPPIDLGRELESRTGLDLDDDVLSWMGDLTVFARGTSVSDLGVGFALETTDPDASRRVLNTIERLATRAADDGERVVPLTLPGGGDGFTVESPELPEPVHVVQRGDRVAMALGDDSATDLLEPTDTLGENEVFEQAAGRLGDGYRVGTYVDVAPVLELAENQGASSDSGYQEAKPYLEPFARLVAGTKADGDVILSRTRIELR